MASCVLPPCHRLTRLGTGPRPGLQLFTPPSELHEAVDSAIVVKRPPGAAESHFPAMPRAMLSATRSGPESFVVCLHALSTQAAAFAHPDGLQALGFVLPPWTAARLMGPSTGALVNVALPWEAVVGGAEAQRLAEGLLLADSDAQALRVLGASLWRRLQRGPERVEHSRAQALQRLCTLVGERGLKAAAELGWGERQLQRRCRAWLGLAPKPLHRITRFHAALGDALRQQRVPHASAALDAGYFDQSHLARESRLLAAAPLQVLLRGARPGLDWWPLATHLLR